MFFSDKDTCCLIHWLLYDGEKKKADGILTIITSWESWKAQAAEVNVSTESSRGFNPDSCFFFFLFRPQPKHHGSGHAVCWAQSAVRQRLYKAREEMHKTWQKRIPEDCYGHSDWVCHHGFHWFFRQTHPHPHQQHHCWRLNPGQFLGTSVIGLVRLGDRRDGIFTFCVQHLYFNV